MNTTHSQVGVLPIESRKTWLRAALLATAATLLLIAGLTTAPKAEAAETNLVGKFQLRGGACSGGKITGTYFRMILPSGGSNGPFMANSDSRCSDQTFTPLRPGSDGGLITGSYQTSPQPAFDSAGNAKAGRVTAPAQYYGTGFATSTNAVDPQTKAKVPAPRITVVGNALRADLRGFSVSWNNQYFNQGAPKPNGGFPGNTRAATGTYNASTGAFTLNWASQIVGGPFDKFTGQWHLEGVFIPAKGTSNGATPQGTTGGTGTNGGGAGVLPGADPSASAAAPGDQAAAAGGAAQVAPGTKVVTTKGWEANPLLLGTTIGIAVLGFGSLIALTLLGRRRPEEAEA